MLEGLDAARPPADAPARPGPDARHQRRRRGRHPHATTGRRARRYAEVGERVDRLAARAAGARHQARATGWRRSPGTPSSTSSSTSRRPCMGAVLHTLNIRLFPEQLAYIANHAQDQIVFVDDSLVAAARAASSTSSRPSSTTSSWATATSATLPNAIALRGAARAPGRRASTTRRSTSARPRALLHERHDRQPEGRPLLAPLERSCTRWRTCLADALGVCARRPHPADRADVPRQRLGPALRGGPGRRAT